MKLTNGPLVICDFGAARLGAKHCGDVMPGPYRAPEVILGMEWDYKVDIWSVGAMVCESELRFGSVLSPRRFGIFTKENGFSTQ